MLAKADRRQQDKRIWNWEEDDKLKLWQMKAFLFLFFIYYLALVGMKSVLLHVKTNRSQLCTSHLNNNLEQQDKLWDL